MEKNLNHYSRLEWTDFMKQVRRYFGTRAAMKNALNLSASTADSAWHGKSIGLVPFLRICRHTGINPKMLLKLDDE